MSSKRRRGGVKARLQKAQKEQKELEDEMTKMQNAQDPKEVSQDIIEHVQKNGPDPMLSDDSWATVNHNRGFCVVL